MPEVTRSFRAVKAFSMLAITASFLTAGASARADDTESCIAAHVEGQRLRKAGKLKGARDAFVQCAKPGCPSLLVEDCTGLLAGVEGALPTVVFEASDAGGRDVADARVTAGGVTLAERLDGKAIELDPGEYVFRFERPSERPVEQVIVVREGDKARKISARFGATSDGAPAKKRAVTPAFWAVGAVGVVGVVLFASLGGAGLAKRGGLDDRACKPNCPSEDVDSIRGLFLGADISLGIGVAALAVAPILYFTSPTITVTTARGEPVNVGVRGSASAVVLVVEGAL